jgi:hypothetical protein
MTSATAEVPSTIDDVNAEWLTAVLRADDTVPDTAMVTDVRAEQIALDSGFSSRLYRAHVSGDGVPNSVIVKLPAESEAGQAMVTMGGYAREVEFYRRGAGRAHRNWHAGPRIVHHGRGNDSRKVRAGPALGGERHGAERHRRRRTRAGRRMARPRRALHRGGELRADGGAWLKRL